MWDIRHRRQVFAGGFLNCRQFAEVVAVFRSLCVLVACIFLGGCFTVTPVRMDRGIDPGRVRIHLAESAASRLTSVLGRNVDDALDAQIVRAERDSLVVEIPSGSMVRFGTAVLYQELRIPFEDVTGLERRQLDRTTPGLLVGGVGAAVGVLLYRSLTGKTGSSITPGVPGPAESLTPLLRFRFR